MTTGALLSTKNIMLFLEIRLGLLFLYLPIDVLLFLNGCLNLKDTLMVPVLEQGPVVAKGFHQQAGLDLSETFSPIIKPTTICIVVTVALAKDSTVRQLDINNAFLSDFLKKGHLYGTNPSFHQSTANGSLACKLNKAIYRLKQAPRAWFERLQTFLSSIDFIFSKSDSSLFL